MTHPYAYLVGDIIFGAIWLILFLLRKDLRKEMISLSLIGAVFFPFALIYLPDYWYPDHIIHSDALPLGIEDFLFAFLIAGIGAVLYEAAFGKSHLLCECRRKNPKGLTAITAAAVIVLLGFTFWFGLNSIYSSYVSFAIIFGYIVYFRKDLFWQALMSGFSVGLVMFLFYQIWIRLYPGIIQHWWKLENISGILIFGTPLEEIIWGFSWGLVGGTIYEFVKGIKVADKKYKRNRKSVLLR